MKRSISIPRATQLAALCFAAAGGSLYAQQTNSPSLPLPTDKVRTDAVANEPEDDSTLVLSPFVVSAEKDTGYIATTTLAGTRIKTELKDVGSAVSVVTDQFLKDTGARNSSDLLVYTTNTEVGGIAGNFGGMGNGQQLNEQNNLLRPQQNTRVRGLTAADNTRGYFLTDIPWDSFNTDRVEIQRGPNSILYGMGSPAGIINAGIQEATYKNTNTVETRFGRFDSYRASINLNRVLLANQLAIRVAALHDKTYYMQKPAFNQDRRLYGALRYDPAFLNKGASHTTLRFNVEGGEIDANRPRVLPPEDNITPWFTKLNKQTYTPVQAWNYTGADTGQVLAASPYYEPWLTGLGNNTSPTAYYSPDGTMTSGFRMPQPMQNFGLNSSGGVDGGIDGIPFQQPIGIRSYSDYAIKANLPYSSLGQYKNTHITDTSIFDYYHQLIDGDTKREWSGWAAFNANLDQTFLNNRLGLQTTVDHQNYHDGHRMLVSNPQIHIDLNSTYTDGTPNPNVGRPYVMGSGQYGNGSYSSQRDAFRMTAFGDIRATDFLAPSWITDLLGRHVFTGLYSHDETKTESRQWEQYAADSTYGTLIGAPSITDTARVINTITYIGPSLAGANTASGAHLSSVNNITIPSTGTIKMFDSTWNASGVSPSATWTDPFTGSVRTQSENPANYVGWRTQQFNILNANNGDIDKLYTSGSKTKDIVESKALIWQGFLWDGAIVPTVGLRKDTDRAYSINATKDSNNGGAMDFSEKNYSLPSTPNNVESGNSTSWSVVVHTPKFLQKNLPEGFDLSLFYNRSDNFKPAAGRVDVLGNSISSPNGETKDYGVVLSALKGKLILKVNRYETSVHNDTLTALNSALWHIGQDETWGWVFAKIYQNNWGPDWQNHYSPWNNQTQEQATAIQNAAVDAFLSNMAPAQFYKAWGIDMSDTAWQTRTNSYSSPVGLTATGDTESKGYEIELTAQPLSNWSVTINASKTTAKNVNIGGAVKDWVEARNAVFQGPAGDIRLWWGGSTDTIKTDWNANFMSTYKLVTLGEGSDVPELRPWRFNLVTNYNFARGFMKGVNVGAGYRWEDKEVIGYALKTDANGESTFDLSHPYHGPTNDAVDCWVGYEHKAWAKAKWRVQLNVRNVFADKKLIPITAQPDGTPAGYRIPEPLVWTITNTFTF